jgi:hypothetical protein
MHIGKEATAASTRGVPPAAMEKTFPAPQSETQSRPSRQRGDSPNTMPSMSTSMTSQTMPVPETHRRARPRGPTGCRRWRTVRWASTTSLAGHRPESLRRRFRADPLARAA